MVRRKIKIDDQEKVVRVGLVLGHEMRVTLLLAFANDGPASATVFARAGVGALNNVAYHLRKLAQLGAVELTRSHRGRGAIERHYRITNFGKGIVALAEVVGRKR